MILDSPNARHNSAPQASDVHAVVMPKLERIMDKSVLRKAAADAALAIQELNDALELEYCAKFKVLVEKANERLADAAESLRLFRKA